MTIHWKTLKPTVEFGRYHYYYNKKKYVKLYCYTFEKKYLFSSFKYVLGLMGKTGS